jgi:hypothetical protein
MPRARLDAVLTAVRGEPGRARELAARVLEVSESDGQGCWDRLEALRGIGLAALLEREPERASASLDAVWEHAVREGVEDPGAFPVAGDLVEALAESGRLEAANEVIARLDRLASEQRHPWGCDPAAIDGRGQARRSSSSAARAGPRSRAPS